MRPERPGTADPCLLARARPAWFDERDGSGAPRPRLLLELEDAEGVLARVDDPGRPGEADIGDAVLGLEPGQVVVLDLDPAGAEPRHLGPEVADLPRRLGLLVGRPNRALGHVQVGAVTALEDDGV